MAGRPLGVRLSVTGGTGRVGDRPPQPAAGAPRSKAALLAARRPLPLGARVSAGDALGSWAPTAICRVNTSPGHPQVPMGPSAGSKEQRARAPLPCNSGTFRLGETASLGSSVWPPNPEALRKAGPEGVRPPTPAQPTTWVCFWPLILGPGDKYHECRDAYNFYVTQTPAQKPETSPKAGTPLPPPG